MTTTAILCFALIVLAASLRAFGPRRPAGEPRRRIRRAGAGLVLGASVPTLDLVGGERSRVASTPLRIADPGVGRGRGGRNGD